MWSPFDSMYEPFSSLEYLERPETDESEWPEEECFEEDNIDDFD